MKPVTNVNLYAFEAGVRRPLKTFATDDKFIAAKVAALVGAELRSATQRGVPDPDFKLVSETRVANESGLVISATFVELDSATGRPLSREFNSLQELLEAKAEDAAPQVVPETAEQKADREAKAKSASLSV